MDREKSSGQTHLFNIGTIEAMNGIARQAQAEFIAQYFFKKPTAV